jgi:hypothetical protein
MIVGEREMVVGIEPAMLGAADRGKGAEFDHGVSHLSGEWPLVLYAYGIAAAHLQVISDSRNKAS